MDNFPKAFNPLSLIDALVDKMSELTPLTRDSSTCITPPTVTNKSPSFQSSPDHDSPASMMLEAEQDQKGTAATINASSTTKTVAQANINSPSTDKAVSEGHTSTAASSLLTILKSTYAPGGLPSNSVWSPTSSEWTEMPVPHEFLYPPPTFFPTTSSQTNQTPPYPGIAALFDFLDSARNSSPPSAHRPSRESIVDFVNSLESPDITVIAPESIKCSFCWGTFGAVDCVDEVDENFSDSGELPALKDMLCHDGEKSHAAVKLPYGHLFGYACLVGILESGEKLCPKCRTEIKV